MIGDLIRAARKARGLTQQALAERAGLTRSSLGIIEVGRAEASPTTACCLAKHLGVDPALLAGLPPWTDATTGERLAILRRRKGWSCLEASGRAGVAHTSICAWEKAARAPHPDLLDCLTMALCGRTAEVLEGEDPGWGGDHV